MCFGVARFVQFFAEEVGDKALSVSAEHADNFVAGFVFPTGGHNLAFLSPELNREW